MKTIRMTFKFENEINVAKGNSCVSIETKSKIVEEKKKTLENDDVLLRNVRKLIKSISCLKKRNRYLMTFAIELIVLRLFVDAD